MNPDPDAKLMLRFQAGEENAFRRLFDKYSRTIVNYCYRFCGEAELAEELAQEVFLKVYRAAGSYSPEAKFSTWIFRIATNTCLNEKRKIRYRTRMESIDASVETEGGTVAKEIEDQGARIETMIEKQEMDEIIQRAITRLPEKQKAALLLRINHGFSYREISEQLNKSENGIKTLIHRGRNQLKNVLQTYLKGE